MFEQRSEGGEGVSQVCIWGNSIPGRENSPCKKNPKAGACIIKFEEQQGGQCGCRDMNKEKCSGNWDEVTVGNRPQVTVRVVLKGNGSLVSGAFWKFVRCFWLSQRWQECYWHFMGGDQGCQKSCKCVGQSHSMGNCLVFNTTCKCLPTFRNLLH